MVEKPPKGSGTKLFDRPEGDPLAWMVAKGSTS